VGAVKKRIIITGGGTGGHVFPGVAVAEELVKQPEVEVVYVGKADGPESKWVPGAGFAFEGVAASSFPRALSLRLLTFWFSFAGSFLKAMGMVGRLKPSAVFSTGGYVSVPLSLSAALRGVPLGLLEPNVVPGLAAKLLSLFSRRIFVGFEKTMGRFSGKNALFTGIPVRAEILSAPKAGAREAFGLNPGTFTLLMLGGSQGAHALNGYMADLIQFLGEGDHEVQALMMTGWNDYKKVVDGLEKCRLKAVLRPFIGNIHEAYAAADLVVARSGALTCAEVLSRGLPSILIPYPHASGHQEANARVLEAAGAAEVILEGELGDEKLSQTVLALLCNPARLKAMGENAKKMAKPGAAAEIARELLEMAK
jgi:UDP-N-acetylglucosamine--N-acetylmuramyl-(pentapeptide) pyrophosphoryl-undecaprenol N-acetylglucosamine transferase